MLVAEITWTDGGARFELASRVIDVDASSDLLRDAIGACDGRRTVLDIERRHGSDAADLVLGLLEAGAMADASEAWRAFHNVSSNPNSRLRPIGADELAALSTQSFRPTGELGEPIAVATVPTVPDGIGRLARRRRSGRAEAVHRPVQLDELFCLLTAALGKADSGALTIPSGGALNPTVLHVLLRQPLGPLAPGIWWYDPWNVELRLQRGGPPAIDPLFVPHSVTDPILERQYPVLALSSDMRRPSRKYGPRGYRMALMEIGAVMQTAYLAAAELDLPVRACAGFHDAGFASLLQLPDGVVCQLTILVGS